MKFFYRTFYSFFAVIALQAILAILLVSGSIQRSQEQDVRNELKAEALDVYDNFNSWKRAMWGTIVDLNQSEELKEILDAQNRIAFDARLENFLKKACAQSGAEFLGAKAGWSAYTTVIPLSDKPVPAPQITSFAVARPHPYVEMIVSGSLLYFCGTVKIESPKHRSIELFIMKRVDEALCRQLNFNSKIEALISVDDDFFVGTMKSGEFGTWMKDRIFPTSYFILDEIVEDDIPYGLVVQQSGTARITNGGDDREGTLYVCTFLSLDEYRNRISFINNSILTVSLIIALFTILISVGMSKAVTEPIRRLRKAMLQLKAGKRPIQVSGPQKGEIADLLKGFNEMTAQIALDDKALSEHIHEITRIKEYNDKIFNSIQEKILVVNSAFIVERANQAFLDFVGMDETGVLGRNIDELSISLFDEPIHESIRAIISGSIPSTQQTRRTQAGMTFEIKCYPLLKSSDENGDSVHCILIIEDVTRKVAYEDKIRQAEKLTSISMLSAGVAHEINNPLSSILTNVQNLIKERKKAEEMDDLQIIEQETKRIARIVRNLLEFSSAGHANPNFSDMNAVVEKLIQLVGYSVKLGNKIEIKADLEKKIPPAAIGEDECKQIILNLVKNAMEASGDCGAIVIKTRHIPNEKTIELAVSDSGDGISPELLPRIFDPFFSTKGEYGNSGLGLSVVYGLVSKFNGGIHVESEVGEGTTVTIILPVAPDRS